MGLVHIFHIQCLVVQFPFICSSIVFLNEWKMESKSILEPSSSNINPGHSSMSWNFQFRIKTIIRQRLIVSVWWILETTQTVGLIITLMPEWLYTRNEVARLAMALANPIRLAAVCVQYSSGHFAVACCNYKCVHRSSFLLYNLFALILWIMAWARLWKM